MPTLTLNDDHITLARALKAAGLVGSGGEAKHVVRSGTVRVNGAVEVHPGRKLVAGDRFAVADGTEWSVTR